ncbi:heterokaryon incompatibility protein-domain-containing protein [Halenospora varia]|nr:heterokaryon incompatibility protein-domain-containing protein [Halenospora varia]
MSILRESCTRSEWSDCEVGIMLWYVWHQQRSTFNCDLLENESLVALSVEVTIFEEDESVGTHSLCLLTEAPPGCCADWLKISRPPSSDALCLENLSMVQEEISKCIERCSDTKDKMVFLPTRLIDLMEPLTPRLVALEDYDLSYGSEDIGIKYAALSYRWGSPSDASSMLKTEKHSLKNRFTGIAICEMPRVVQEAISVCHKLSIRYLWVDALCIVQDDQLDWEQEAFRMGKVYEGAFVTIVPLAAHTCHEGFLQRSQEIIRVRFQSIIRPEIHGNFYLRHVPRFNINQSFHFPSLHGLELQSSTWGTRGWTFQEETLSSRLLYFGEATVFLYCHNWLHLESYDRGYNESRLSFDKHISLSNPLTLYEEWEEGVPLFANRFLSYPKDRFPAISALARKIAIATKDEYVAGIWRRNLFRGLLWHVTPEDRWENFLISLTTPDPYIAPSWSWASRNCYLDFGTERHQLSVLHTNKITEECKIIDINVDVPGCNPFGVVSSAVLSLAGKLAPLPAILQWMPTRSCSPT